MLSDDTVCTYILQSKGIFSHKFWEYLRLLLFLPAQKGSKVELRGDSGCIHNHLFQIQHNFFLSVLMFSSQVVKKISHCLSKVTLGFALSHVLYIKDGRRFQVLKKPSQCSGAQASVTQSPGRQPHSIHWVLQGNVYSSTGWRAS